MRKLYSDLKNEQDFTDYTVKGSKKIVLLKRTICSLLAYILIWNIQSTICSYTKGPHLVLGEYQQFDSFILFQVLTQLRQPCVF